MQDVGGDPKGYFASRRVEASCRESRGQQSFGKALVQKAFES